MSFIEQEDNEQFFEFIKEKENLKEIKAEENQRKQMENYSWEKIRKNFSRKDHEIKNVTFNSIDEFCNYYTEILLEEISYLQRLGGKHHRVYDGKYIEKRNGLCIYRFETDSELHYPDGTQINAKNGQEKFTASIVNCEAFTIIIESKSDLGKEIQTLDFSVEDWHLIEALIERLDEIKRQPSKLVKELVCNGSKAIEHNNMDIITGQKAAIDMSNMQPITFVWGPPGTGKTQTLAEIALSHISKGNKVLMLSYSNVSVDGAIMRTYSLLKKKQPGVIVRYGYARQKDVLDHKYLTTYNLAIYNHPELVNERNKLKKEQKCIELNSKNAVKIERRLQEIRNKLEIEEKNSIKTAQFVATTVSKAMVDSTIRNLEFDVVIFDEVSMAYIPQVVFAASLAKKIFICMGDFKQLPPIVQKSNESILNIDIFQHCGITKAVKNRKKHRWLCMLDTQYRMHPEIAKFASMTMYDDLLKTAVEIKDKRKYIVNNKPFEGRALGLVDLSGMMSVCKKTEDNSSINVLSAFISFALAIETAPNSEVGIITPYNAQSRLIHAMIRDLHETSMESREISCATVHQFQGSEKDIIIYDAVDCYRKKYPGSLLTSTKNDYANRLFNVALTRAKGKFIGVVNSMYMQDKLSNELIFKKMIELQKELNSNVKGDYFEEYYSCKKNSLMNFYDDEEGSEQFLKDIQLVDGEIRIDIPDQIADKQINKLEGELQKLQEKGKKVIIRAENKKTLPDSMKKIAIESNLAINPIVIIDKKIVWFGMPLSRADFIIGGKRVKSDYRPIIQFKGQYTARALYGFAEMNKITRQIKKNNLDEIDKEGKPNFAYYVLQNQKCPICGKAMNLRKNKEGKFFLGCTNYPRCEGTNNVELEVINRYIYRNDGVGQKCDKCGYSLEAKTGKYGGYIQCCGPLQHKYKLDEI